MTLQLKPRAFKMSRSTQNFRGRDPLLLHQKEMLKMRVKVCLKTNL